MHVALFERRIGVALFGGHEAGAHLYPLGPQLQNVVDVLARVNAAAGDDRDMAVVRRLEGVHLLHDRGQDLFERVVLVLDLIGLVAEVAAGLRPFDDDRVGNVAVVGQPLFAQEFRGTGRRDDRRQFCAAALGEERRQVQRQPGTREDDVGLLLNGGFHHVGEVGHGDHDVDTDDAARLFAGLAQLFAQPPDARYVVVGRIVAVNDTESGRGDNAHAAFVGDGRGQSRKRDADAHSALNDGRASQQIADFE